jgi:multimeric flavodoxin WrbA
MTNRDIILSFSGRKGGNCEQIADFIAENNDKPVKLYRMWEQNIHMCGDCGYECFAPDKECPHSADDERAVLDDICNSDTAYFLVPNYCGGPPAMLYALNERSVSFFAGHPERLERYMNVRKKFIVISSNQPDTFNTAFIQHDRNPREILWLSAREFGLRSMDTNLLQIDEVRERIRAFMR